MQVGRFHDCYEIQPAGRTLALWLKASEGASARGFLNKLAPSVSVVFGA
jgi:hypothetical protein